MVALRRIIMENEKKFICMNCRKELPEFFAIHFMEQTDENSFKYVEKKLNILTLKKQGINIICPNCKDETFIAAPHELNNKKNDENEKEEPFKKYEVIR
jgi:hypothetical protein